MKKLKLKTHPPKGGWGIGGRLFRSPGGAHSAGRRGSGPYTIIATSSFHSEAGKVYPCLFLVFSITSRPFPDLTRKETFIKHR